MDPFLLPRDGDSTPKTNLIQTKGRFCFMELPAELRLKVYELLLICDGDIELPSDGLGEAERQHRIVRGVPLYTGPQPAVAIMETCKLANEETVPILWSQNSFAICLPVDLTLPFFLHKLRWSTISHITSLTFTSNTTPRPDHSAASYSFRTKYTRPQFTCSGLDILARYSASDFLYSPYGPDLCMSLSIRNWVSTNVTRAELHAIQLELEAMTNSGPTLLPLFLVQPPNGPAPDTNGDAQA